VKNQSSPKLTRRQLVRGGIAALSAMLLSERWASAVEPQWFEIAPVELALPRLQKPFDGYSVAQLSDIHLGDGMTRERLQKIVEKTNSLNADLVVITGDFVSGDGEVWAKDLTQTLSQLKARDGVAAVLGNHDIWSGASTIRRALRDAGIRELNNDVLTLRRRGAQTFIVGLDDPCYGEPNLAPLVAALPRDGAAILLAHEPDFADEFSLTGRFDLQLSGHSHGGQVCAPFIGPLILPSYGRKYPRGLYRVGEMLLYTNRGVGSTGLPYRFNCRPEITHFTLRAA
jgi:uncharacterized protein